MISATTGYKFVAIVSLSYALFSCTHPVESQSNSELLAKLDEMDAKIDALGGSMTQVQSAVVTNPGACTIQEVIDQNFANCDAAKIPQEVAATTTYCIEQGRSGEIGAEYALGFNTEIDIGAGWPNVVWGKLVGHLTTPVPGVVAVPWPTEVAASGGMSLGRGMSLCVDIPITALEADQITQIHDLVRGVNEGLGKYSRRTGRLLNYAARRTPIAVVNKASMGANEKFMPEDADDAFDIADAAMDRLIDGEFQPLSSGSMIFADPVFQDLFSSLEIPTPVADTILDPEGVFESLTTIGQSNIANACNTMGISASSRARSPALANQCARFGLYPNVTAQWEVAEWVQQARDRVNLMYTSSSLRTFMCSNIALAIFTPDC
jgi:hypothetical protein